MFSKIGLTIAVVVLVSSCGSAEDAAPPASGDLTIVASTSVWGDVVRNVVGDHATVEVLMPIGADPHAFEPSSRDAAELQSADLVVINGLGLEQRLDDLLDTVRAEGGNVLAVGDVVNPVAFSSRSPNCTSPDTQSAEGGDVHDGADTACDPHVWMDPRRVADAADAVAAALASMDPTIDWQAGADAYRTRLIAADDEIVSVLANVPETDRVMVTNHDAFGYLAGRYGFAIVGVVIPGGSTLAAPSSADLAELVDVMRSSGVTVVFADTTAPTVLAEAVASELGVDVSVVDLYSGSLGEQASGAGTLIDMLTWNAQTIADALRPA